MKKCGMIIVDKPKGMTSHSVVSRMRRILNTRRVGHTGTLDPMATGVLPVLFGVATKLSEQLSGEDKTYIASFRLGITTDTQDITGTVLSRSSVDVSFDEVADAVAAFRGAQEQIPPMYSAVKIDGQKLYELARKGRSVERAPRPIHIYRAKLLKSTAREDFEAEFEVSKGTYIRTLVDDIGKRLGCGATLTELRRTKSGSFDIKRAFTLEELCGLQEEGRIAEAISGLDRLLLELPSIKLGEKHTQKIKNGVQVPAEEILGSDGLPVILDTCCSFNLSEPVRLFDEMGAMFALASFCRANDGVKLRLLKSLWEVSE